MSEVSYHDTVNDLQGLDLPGHGPFVELPWFLLLEQAGHRPFAVLAKDGATSAVLIGSMDDRHLKSLTNWYAFSWSTLASTAADEPALLHHIARALSVRADMVTLEKLPHSHAQTLRHAFRTAGWITAVEQCDVNHVLPVRGRSFADYMASRPGPVRTTLKRKGKKVEVELLTQFQDDAWDSYERVYAESWKPEEGDPALLRRFAQDQAARGHLRMALARHDGMVVAAQFWTVQDGTAYIHKLAHLESAKPLSPGTTLTAALMEQVIDRDGVAMVDFGTGDDPYKRDWMEQVRTRHRLTCWRPAAPANWPKIAKNLLRKLV